MLPKREPTERLGSLNDPLKANRGKDASNAFLSTHQQFAQHTQSTIQQRIPAPGDSRESPRERVFLCTVSFEGRPHNRKKESPYSLNRPASADDTNSQAAEFLLQVADRGHIVVSFVGVPQRLG